jgi:hypothetical protein
MTIASRARANAAATEKRNDIIIADYRGRQPAPHPVRRRQVLRARAVLSLVAGGCTV